MQKRPMPSATELLSRPKTHRYYYKHREYILQKIKTPEFKAKERIRGHKRRAYFRKRYHLRRREEPGFWIKQKHNITLDERENLKKKQKGRCAICNKKRALVVDHCHETGTFRGMLCISCNTGLGKFGDNIPGILRALTYLRGG